MHDFGEKDIPEFTLLCNVPPSYLHTKPFLVLPVISYMGLKTKSTISALLKTWHAIMFTAALLLLQVYTGEVNRSYISLLLLVLLVMIRISAATVRAMYGSDAQTLIDFISEAMFASWMILNVPLLIKWVFLLFLGTTAVCLFLYSKFEDKIVGGGVQDTVSKVIELSDQVQKLLLQVQVKGIDTSRCERIIEKAEEFIIMAQKCFRGEYYTEVDLYMQDAINEYEKAIKCLKSLR